MHGVRTRVFSPSPAIIEAVGWAKRPDANASGGVPTIQRRIRIKMVGTAQERLLPTLRTPSPAIIGATDSRNIALHGIRQVLLRTRMHHPLEVMAVDPIERQRHQRRRDGANARFGKRNKV